MTFMLLSLVPVFNRHVAKQFIFSALLNCVEMVMIIGYLSQWPLIMRVRHFPKDLCRRSLTRSAC